MQQGTRWPVELVALLLLLVLGIVILTGRSGCGGCHCGIPGADVAREEPSGIEEAVKARREGRDGAAPVAPALPAETVQSPPPAPPTEVREDEVTDALVLFADAEPTDGVAPLTVRFTVRSLKTDEMNQPTYTWNFGDGSAFSDEAGPTHIYDRPGTFTATIRVVDADGKLGYDEVEIEIGPAEATPVREDEVNDALVLFADAEPMDGVAPLAVKFTVRSLKTDTMKGPEYTWDFGDGSTPSHAASPTHTYDQPGKYNATIRVVDTDGLQGYDEVEIEVSVADRW